MSQPSVVRFARRSAAGSSIETKTAGWPRRTPSARKWPANTVFALPAWPATTVARRRGRPPIVTWSNPGMPVSSFSTPAAGADWSALTATASASRALRAAWLLSVTTRSRVSAAGGTT